MALLAHDPDPFARWDAGQTLALSRLDRLIATGGRPRTGMEAADPTFVDGMRTVLRDRAIDPALTAEILTLPSERHLAERMERIDVDAIHHARRTSVTPSGRISSTSGNGPARVASRTGTTRRARPDERRRTSAWPTSRPPSPLPPGASAWNSSETPTT